jgi:site-specific DNA recombinase
MNAERHFSLLSGMEADEARLEREEREWERPRQARRQVVANLAAEWDRPDFTLERKQAEIAQTLTAIVLNSGGKGVRFHHSQITPVFREEG